MVSDPLYFWLGFFLVLISIVVSIWARKGDGNE